MDKNQTHFRAGGHRDFLEKPLVLEARALDPAAVIAGVDCPMREYLGDDPVSFVISLNLKRRHLDESQRVMVAAKLATSWPVFVPVRPSCGRDKRKYAERRL